MSASFVTPITCARPCVLLGCGVQVSFCFAHLGLLVGCSVLCFLCEMLLSYCITESFCYHYCCSLEYVNVTCFIFWFACVFCFIVVEEFAFFILW
jgi:hypothetical protein